MALRPGVSTCHRVYLLTVVPYGATVILMFGGKYSKSVSLLIYEEEIVKLMIRVSKERRIIKLSLKVLKARSGFPGGAVVENLPANAGDTGSSPGLGRSHMPQSDWAREPQLLSLRV